MPNIFFTSDLHIGHKNILKYNRHEFSTIEDMEIQMVSRWNSKVGKDDIVYILGDVSFTNLERTLFVLSQLNGEKHLILGNHDRGKEKQYEESGAFASIKGYDEFRIKRGKESHYFHLSHFPSQHWSHQAYGSIHLFGHLHGFPHNLTGKCMDVGLDTNDMYPYSYEEVISLMRDKPVVNPRRHTDCSQFKLSHGIVESSPIVLFLVGLPASGKTTYRNKLLENNTFKIISSDDYIIEEAGKLGKTYNDCFSDFINKATKKVNDQLNSLDGSDYLIDMTNISAAARRKKIKLIPDYYTLVSVFVDAPLTSILERNKRRTGQVIPENVIMSMWENLEIPTKDEGFSYCSTVVVLK